MSKTLEPNSNKTLRIFNNATAIITGGASGIGRALGEELAKRDCEVVLADLQIELAEEVASAIRESGGKATASKLNVTDFSAVQVLIEETVQRTGRLDYMFNNAGIAIAGGADLHSIEDWNQVIDVNLKGVINGVHSAYQIMLKQGFGHIINTASMAGLLTMPGGISYATAKFAVVGLSKTLRIEAKSFGIRVSVICPGAIRTPILDNGGKFGKSLVDIPADQINDNWERFKPMDPNLFAVKVLAAVAKNKAIIIEPAWWRIIWLIDRLWPALGMFMGDKAYQSLLKMQEA